MPFYLSCFLCRYECNRPPWGESNSGTTDLNRYLWYFERYFNHSQSGKVAERQVTDSQQKMDDLASDGGMHVRATEFLLQAVRVVIECRRILRWTYVHAYYIDSGAERTLFEYRQGQLEAMTETLNKLTEGDVEQLSAARMQVLNMTQALAAYMEGMENDQVASMVKRNNNSGAERGEGQGDEKEGDEKQGKGSAKGTGKGGKAKGGKAKKAMVDEWTTDAQGVIVRGQVEEGNKKAAAAEPVKKTTGRFPLLGALLRRKKEEQPQQNEGNKEEDEDGGEEDEGEEEVEEEEVESGGEAEENVPAAEGDEMEQQAILADIRARHSPTSAAALASTAAGSASNASKAESIVLE